jgi:hypothetical protein
MSFALASLWCLLAQRRFCSWSCVPLVSGMIAARPFDLRRWHKAPVREGVGSNRAAATRFDLISRSACASRRAKSMTPGGLPGPSADALSIGPRGRCSRSTFRCDFWADCLLRRRRACHRSSTLLASPWGSVLDAGRSLAGASGSSRTFASEWRRGGHGAAVARLTPDQKPKQPQNPEQRKQSQRSEQSKQSTQSYLLTQLNSAQRIASPVCARATILLV